MDLESSLPCSQKPATGTEPEPQGSGLHCPTFIYSVSSSDYTVSNDTMIHESWITKDMKGSQRGRI
jgi:hypothetical protein